MLALLAAARFAHDAAVALLFGLVAFPTGAVQPAESRLAVWIKGAAVLAPLTAVIELLLMAANMGGSLGAMVDPAVLSAAATDTWFGKVWLARVALALVVAVIALRSRGRPGRGLVVLAALLLASIALTGHSALPGGALGGLHRAADAVHLLAAGWWLGGLLALAILAPALRDAAVLLGCFSRIGYAAVAAILASGAIKSWLLLGSLPPLARTAYGRLLLVKVALFLAMGLIALANRVWITPALAREGDSRLWLGRLRRHANVELGLGLAVLAVVGLLGALSPPVSD
jgi:putative copper resistance protein D